MAAAWQTSAVLPNQHEGQGKGEPNGGGGWQLEQGRWKKDGVTMGNAAAEKGSSGIEEGDHGKGGGGKSVNGQTWLNAATSGKGYHCDGSAGTPAGKASGKSSAGKPATACRDSYDSQDSNDWQGSYDRQDPNDWRNWRDRGWTQHGRSNEGPPGPPPGPPPTPGQDDLPPRPRLWLARQEYDMERGQGANREMRDFLNRMSEACYGPEPFQVTMNSLKEDMKKLPLARYIKNATKPGSELRIGDIGIRCFGIAFFPKNDANRSQKRLDFVMERMEEDGASTWVRFHPGSKPSQSAIPFRFRREELDEENCYILAAW